MRIDRRFPVLVSVCLLGLAAPVLHAQTPEPPKKEISEKISGSLGQLRTLAEAKDYAGALALIDSLIAVAEPASFDAYILVQLKVQILINQGKYIEAVEPLEIALRLGEGNANFLDAPARLEQLHLLAQLYYQEAAELKDVAARRAGYEKSLATLNRWFELSPRITADISLFAATLLFQLGTLEGAPDAARLREAISRGREGLLLSVKPSAQLHEILVACHLQLGETAAAAELLEVLAARDRVEPGVWSRLQSIYLTAATDTKDVAAARRWNLRALHALDRAQAAGLMNTPKDQYTRVAILFNVQQFTRAAALLEAGFADGSIDAAKRDHWELLTSAYQQTHQEPKALDALTRAVAKFPDDAALEFSLAQLLYGTGRVDDAYARGQAAFAKGTLEKPGQAQVYLAYLAYELQRHDEARKWVAAARAAGDVPATTLDPLAAAIDDAELQKSGPM